jgi:hypothetical protein
MATVSANELSLEKTLEELITEFNSLRGDVSSVTLEALISTASSQIVFEGATDDGNETTLTVVDPTADRTVTFPDATGVVLTTGNADVGATTTTFADLDQFLIADGAVLKKMALSTIAASLPALTPASANANALGSASLEWSDLFLGDGSVINFGNDQDVKLTHVADTGLLLNGTSVIQFNDASQNIGAPSNAILDINATDEIELNATLVDVNANLDVSGTIVSGGVITGTAFTAGSAVLAEAELELLDGLTAGTAIASKVVTTDANIDTTGQRNLTISGELDAATLDISGAIDVAGNSVLASVDVTGVATASTFEPDGDTSAGDNAAIGYTAAEGLILTGQGSTNDITIKNDADADVIEVPTGTVNVTMAGTLGTGGLITSGAGLVIANAGTIGSAGDVDAMAIGSDGDVTLTQDLELQHDGAILSFGANDEVSLTHVHNTGILLNSTMAIQFNDASQFINAPSNAILDINATDEIELNATLIDVNGNLDVSGTIVGAGAITGGGLMTTGGNIVIPDAGTIGSATDVDAIAIGSDGDITLTQDLELQHDGAILSFGANDEVTLTHVHDTGILLNSTMAIQFNDASQFINAPSNAILDINATDEIELNATLVDINANVEISGNLSVAGTTTQVNTVTMNAQNAVIFEGATADASETTLTIVDPTADRTINLPNQSGTIPVLAAASNTAITSTPEELNILDGATVVVGEINALDIGSTAVGTAVASKAVILDSNKDYTGIRNFTVSGELDAATGDFSGNVDVDGTIVGASTIQGTTITATTAFVPDASDGATLGTNSLEFSDLFLADGALINWGNDQDVSIKHVADTGLTITNTNGAADNNPIVLQLKSEEDAIIANEVIASLEFAAGDSDGTDGATVAAGIHAIAEGTFSASANATKLVFTTGVSETAASSATAKMTLSSAGLLTIADDLIIKNAGTIGTAADADLLTMGNGNLTVAGTVTATAGATLLIKNASGSTLKTIKGMT